MEAPAAKKPDTQAAQPTKAAKEEAAQSEDEEESESEEESDSDDESEEDSDEVRSRPMFCSRTTIRLLSLQAMSANPYKPVWSTNTQMHHLRNCRTHLVVVRLSSLHMPYIDLSM